MGTLLPQDNTGEKRGIIYYKQILNEHTIKKKSSPNNDLSGKKENIPIQDSIKNNKIIRNKVNQGGERSLH